MAKDSSDQIFGTMEFLKMFSSGLDEEQKRGELTEAAKDSKGNTTINLGSKSQGKSTPGISRIAKDIAIQPGTKTSEYTLQGTPGKKGWGSTIGRFAGMGVGALVGGPGGAMAGAQIGGSLGATAGGAYDSHKYGV